MELLPWNPAVCLVGEALAAMNPETPSRDIKFSSPEGSLEFGVMKNVCRSVLQHRLRKIYVIQFITVTLFMAKRIFFAHLPYMLSATPL